MAIVSTTFITDRPRQYSELAKTVARIVGGQDDNEVLRDAKDFINESIDRINLADVFSFCRLQNSSITLLDGDDDYMLSSVFYKESKAQLFDTSSKPDETLIYYDWPTFQSLVENQEDTGKPVYYTLKNTFNEGLIYVYPVPNSSAASDYTLEVHYYKPIPRLVEDDDVLFAPQIVEPIVLDGARALMLEHKHGPGSGRDKWQLFFNGIKQLKANENRHPDEHPRFTIPRMRRATGTVYIKID